ncbi:hypothetical protein Y032_0702g1663 [Ancylostoma ceylanicum]|uniref:Uncharacterized protein n=1 Tax=Ancylostoma ceylanicum TaxID=53326 RepID=A0A016WI51_9BILA|nr:hypothetical protein Y032_0702g1663 [Ancylostoma ceylanicum]
MPGLYAHEKCTSKKQTAGNINATGVRTFARTSSGCPTPLFSVSKGRWLVQILGYMCPSGRSFNITSATYVGRFSCNCISASEPYYPTRSLVIATATQSSKLEASPTFRFESADH